MEADIGKRGASVKQIMKQIGKEGVAWKQLDAINQIRERKKFSGRR